MGPSYPNNSEKKNTSTFSGLPYLEKQQLLS